MVISEPHLSTCEPPFDLAAMPVLTEELAHLRRDPSGETGHRWQISCSEFSPDGSLLASGSWDKEVRIWDLSSLETKLRLKGVHDVPITSLSWHKPRGGLLCVGSADCTASLWDSQKGAHLASLTDHDGWVLDVSFSSNGKLLATASWDSNVRFWDSVTQSCIGKLAGHEKVCQHCDVIILYFNSVHAGCMVHRF